MTKHPDIKISRVANGYLVFEDKPSDRGSMLPLYVAETPDSLVKLIRGWIVAHENSPD